MPNDTNKMDFQSTPMLSKFSPGPTPTHALKPPASSAQSSSNSLMSKLFTNSNPVSDVKLASAIGGTNTVLTSSGDRIQTVKAADLATAQQLKSFSSLFTNINKSVGSALSSLMSFQQNPPVSGDATLKPANVAAVPPDKLQPTGSARSAQPQSTFVPIERPPVTPFGTVTSNNVRPNYHQPVPAPRPQHSAHPPPVRPPMGGVVPRMAPPPHVSQHLPAGPHTGYQPNAPFPPQSSAGEPQKLQSHHFKSQNCVFSLSLQVRRIKGKTTRMYIKPETQIYYYFLLCTFSEADKFSSTTFNCYSKKIFET